MTLLVVAGGGAVGALVRYLVSGWVQSAGGGFFPWGTFTVNVAGSFLLGFSMVWLQTTVASPETRALVTIGFLGSFTTFSTFSYEAVAMLRDGEFWRAGGYLAGSVTLGLLGVLLGMAAASTLTHTRS